VPNLDLVLVPDNSIVIKKRSYARLGIIGNPSDGYHGKTISCTIENFWAEVEIFESDQLTFIPHPKHDGTRYKSMLDLKDWIKTETYHGGIRLLKATCKKFYDYFVLQSKLLSPEAARRNFTVKYFTTVPRQVGLAGSSAIITSLIKCLIEFYGIHESNISKPLLAETILAVERDELGIAAGLQDRVVQLYEGLVYMDFSEELTKKQGHGNYHKLDISLLPPLYLAYAPIPSDSGKIHSTVRDRWNKKDKEVITAMSTLAGYAEEALELLKSKNLKKLHDIINANFDVRRKIFGDDVIGNQNLQMIEIARGLGASAKFSGSGGAIFGILPENYQPLQNAMRNAGFEFELVKPYNSD